MSDYPPRHHPCFMLEDALTALGAEAQVVRDERTEGCWGLIVNGKRMVWLIDNRHPHEAQHEDPAAQRLLDAGVLVCHAQKPDMERVGGRWLPLAVTPGYRLPVAPFGKLYDVGFVGYVRDMRRHEVMLNVARHFTNWIGGPVFGDDAVSIYWISRIGLNVPTNYGAPDAYDSANMRLFEILATGAPLVTPYEPYLKELGLQSGINYLAYTDTNHLITTIDSFLKTPDLLEMIGTNGADLATARHTYRHRAEQVLAWLK